MIAIYLIGVIFLFLYLIISDERNDIVWDACLAIGWPVVLAFMLFLGALVVFGFGNSESDWL